MERKELINTFTILFLNLAVIFHILNDSLYNIIDRMLNLAKAVFFIIEVSFSVMIGFKLSVYNRFVQICKVKRHR